VGQAVFEKQKVLGTTSESASDAFCFLANPWGWNGYVFLCCLSADQPFIRWSYHVQGE
jgi:hypothetical protein